MGATSVTGVSGVGDVSGNQKGSEHMSLGVAKLVGPRVAAAGTATLSSSGTVTVDFPAVGTVLSQFMGMAVDTNATVGAVNVTALTLTSIALKGTASHVVNWMVVKTQ